MAHRLDDALRARLKANLDAFAHDAHDDSPLKHAAVAFVVAGSDDDPAEAGFLLTKRAPRLSGHPGQWAIPGGRVDPGESPLQGALRELREEVGLALDDSDLLGRLDDYPTRSGYLISPFVFWGGPAPDLVLNPAEVAFVWRVPLAELERPDAPVMVEIEESDRPVIQMPIRDRHIHAPTAAVMYQFREVALAGRATRVAHLEQPVFAWR
ncbi:MAG: CoA pyrophosphatase [Alphaproteobacteria bacterium]